MKCHHTCPIKLDDKGRLAVGWRANVAIGVLVAAVVEQPIALALHVLWQAVFEKEQEAHIARRQRAAIDIPKHHFVTCVDAGDGRLCVDVFFGERSREPALTRTLLPPSALLSMYH